MPGRRKTLNPSSLEGLSAGSADALRHTARSKMPKEVCPAANTSGSGRLGLVAQLTGVVVGAGPLARQAQEMAEQVRSIFDANACVIRLLDGEELVLLASSGVPAENLHPRIPIHWGISKEIIEGRRPIFIQNVCAHPATAQAANRLPSGYQFVSYAGAPLLHEDQPIGIFGIYWREAVRAFTDADLDWLRILANNTSVAIVNERLYGAVHQQKEALEAEVAERRRATQSLREERDRAQQYLDIAGVVLVALGADERIRLINRKGCELLGYTEGELLGANWFETCIPPGHRVGVQEGFRRLLDGRTEGIERFENAVLTRDGQERLVQWHNTVLRDASGIITGTLSSGEDITQRKQLEQQILQTQKMESIGTLAGGIAHDFGNILAVVLGNVSMCQRQPGLSSKVQEMLADIATAAERGAALTQQLLAYARGGVQNKVPADLNGVIRIVHALLSRVSSSVVLELALAEDMPTIMADVTQIEQVVMNLCLNAIQASKPDGRIEISTDVQMLAAADAATFQVPAGRYVRCRVRDEGVGMDEATRERVFEPFFTTKPMGRGMGMSACLGIVQSHHGQICINSAPGQGTTVTVWLPVAPDHRLDPKQGAQPSPEAVR